MLIFKTEQSPKFIQIAMPIILKVFSLASTMIVLNSAFRLEFDEIFP